MNCSQKAFLRYFYTGRLDPEVDAVEILELASEFKVADLKRTSVDKILEDLCENNAIKIFNLWKQHASEDLAKSAYETLKRMYPELDDEWWSGKRQWNRRSQVRNRYFEVIEKVILNHLCRKRHHQEVFSLVFWVASDCGNKIAFKKTFPSEYFFRVVPVRWYFYQIAINMCQGREFVDLDFKTLSDSPLVYEKRKTKKWKSISC